MPSYDKSRPLIIDPVLSYSTFLGGSWDEQPTSAIIVDSSGSVYVTGLTWSPDFPTSPGALDPSCGADGTCDSGFLDVFVTKLNAQGSDILYSTYLGGSGDDNAWGFAVSSSGNAYIVGNTSSADFPTTAGAFDATCGTDGACNGTDDGFVTVLNAAGTALVYSTYFGGSSDEFAEGVAVDGAGNAYVTGATWSSDYPTTSATAFQPTLAGDNDGFFAKLDPDVSGSGSLLYSTYLGGSYGDHAWRVVVDSAGNAYISGWTYSFNFPTTPGVFQPTHADTTINADAFAAKLDPALAGAASLVYSTFLGGAATDRPEALALDASGNAYLAGWTTSSDFPTTPYSFDTACGTDGTCNGGLEDAFVAKLNPTATALEYSTYLGATGDDYARGLAVDSSGNAYVTGGTNSTDFPAINAIQVLNAGSHDAFVTWLDSAGSSLLFSTYLGGGSEDSGFGIAVDGIGNIHVVGHTRSPDLPTTPGAYDTTCGTDGTCNGGLMDAFIAKIAFVPIVSLSPTSHDFGSLVVGATSGSLTVTLDNTGDAPLDIFTIEATGDFAVNDHTCPISPAQLLAGENCTIWVNFAPTALGNRTGTLSITDSAAGSPHTVELAGYGLPAMQFSATTLDFGNQVVGTSSGPRLVTLTNNDIELSFFIYSISATGDFAQTNNCPIYPAGALVGGESCNISVTFTPTATGAATGAITVTTDAPLSPHVVDLTGNGIASSGPTTCFPIIGQLQENYGRTPILFAANQGQTDPRVQFFARGRGYTLFLTGEEAVLALQKSEVRSQKPGATARIPSPESRVPGLSRTPSPESRIPSVVRLKLVGANPSAGVAALDEQPGKSNFFLGNDPTKWHTNVPNYAKVRYKDVWPGIDLVYYGKETGVRSQESGVRSQEPEGDSNGRAQLEFDFVVSPGADPRVIAVNIEGAEKMEIDAAGNLLLRSAGGEVRLEKPTVYQPAPDNGPRTTDHGPRQSSIFNRQSAIPRRPLRSHRQQPSSLRSALLRQEPAAHHRPGAGLFNVPRGQRWGDCPRHCRGFDLLGLHHRLHHLHRFSDNRRQHADLALGIERRLRDQAQP